MKFIKSMLTIKTFLIFGLHFFYLLGFSQNSLVGDGFGGRLWYKPNNYTVGAYSAYTVCGDSLQLYGWGDNLLGQLGDGTKISTSIPVKTNGMTMVKFYSTGYIMGAIKMDESAWIWGIDTTLPIKVLDNVKFLDAGIAVVSFVKNDGTVWSIGANAFGTFGNDSTNFGMTHKPVKMKGIKNAVRISNSYRSNLVLLADSTLMVTGYNQAGILGQNSTNDRDFSFTPIPIKGIKNIIDIKSNTYNHIALDKYGDVYAWGDGNYGCNGNGLSNNSYPTKIAGLSNIVAISGCNDGYHFLALDDKHNCYTWGKYNRDASSINSTPILLANDVVDIMAGETFSYIIKTDGSLWCSGNSKGGSIWLNLSNKFRNDLTEINPTIPPLNLCSPQIKRLIKMESTLRICDGQKILFNHQYYNKAGHYRDTIISTQDCDTIQILHLEILPTTNTFQSIRICKGDSIKIGKNYYRDSGTYFDTLRTAFGCDSIVTKHLSISCNFKLFNVFTPNKDGLNDIFEIVGDEDLVYDIKIYNRWGMLVYQNSEIKIKDKSKCWNGRFMNKEKDCPDGTYYYLFKPHDDSNEIINGVIELMR